MKRIDDLLDAATSRFRYDDGLRQEITRELRAHLEDAVAAARAEGMDEAQAEEAAVGAFGDAEEVGEKLWQANRRRIRRRAAAMAAVGVVLMPAGILAAGWFITWLLPWGGDHALIGSLTFAVIYLLTRLFLPKTARFGLAFLRWLPSAFAKSMGIVFRNAWIWVPAFALFASIVASNVISQWHILWPRGFVAGPRWWDFIRGYQDVVHAYLPRVQLWLLLYLGYLLFAARIGRRLQSASGLAPSRARRWHVAFIVGALAGTLEVTISQWTKSTETLWRTPIPVYGDHGQVLSVFGNHGQWLSALNALFNIASLPFGALVSAIWLMIVIRRLRGQPLSLNGVFNSALLIIGPMVWIGLIPIVAGVGISLFRIIFNIQNMWFATLWQEALRFLRMATAFLPIIVVTEQCELRRACVRFGDFVGCHLWRYVAFVFLGMLLLDLPLWAAGAAFGSVTGHELVFLFAICAAIQFALQLALTVMCFEFYLTRAGTIVPTAAEEAAAPPT
jgi:hypothetical protein